MNSGKTGYPAVPRAKLARALTQSNHPRLWVGRRTLPAVIKRSQTYAKPWRQQLVSKLKEYAEDPRIIPGQIGRMGRPDFLAAGLGMAWLLTKDKRYAVAGETLLSALHVWLKGNQGGDAAGMAAEAAAYLYDWMYDYWKTTNQADRFAEITVHLGRDALRQFLDVLILDDWHNHGLGLQAGALAAAIAVGADYPALENGELLKKLHNLHLRRLPYSGVKVQDAFKVSPTQLSLNDALWRDGGAGFSLLNESTSSYHSVDVLEVSKIAGWWSDLLNTASKDEKHNPKLVWPQLQMAGFALLHTLGPDGMWLTNGDAIWEKPNYRALHIFLLLHQRTPHPAFEAFLTHWSSKIEDPFPIHPFFCGEADLLRAMTNRSRNKKKYPGLPTSVHFNPLTFMRSGWGANDTVVLFKSGRNLGRHNHRDHNSFSIFRNAPLAVDPGVKSMGQPYRPEYYSRTVAHNAILVVDPNEKSWRGRWSNPESNDGGQRDVSISFSPPNPTTGAPHPNLTEAHYQKNRDELDMGQTLGFISKEHLDYVAGDATRAYTYPWSGIGDNPSRRVEEAVREIFFLKPNLVIVVDRVEATKSHFIKKWLLHSVNAPFIFRNGGWQALPSGIHSRLPKGPYLIKNRYGQMLVRTLHPEKTNTRAVGGKGYECWVDAFKDTGRGTNVAPKNYDPQTGAWRLEVSPARLQKRALFVTVLQTGLSSERNLPDRFLFELDVKAQTATLVVSKRSKREHQAIATLNFRTKGPFKTNATYRDQRIDFHHTAPQRIPNKG